MILKQTLDKLKIEVAAQSEDRFEPCDECPISPIECKGSDNCERAQSLILGHKVDIIQAERAKKQEANNISVGLTGNSNSDQIEIEMNRKGVKAMTFKESLSELREKYGDSAALTYTVTIYQGVEHVSIYAMGKDKCALAPHYRDAIDALDKVFKREHYTSEAPDEEDTGK